MIQLLCKFLEVCGWHVLHRPAFEGIFFPFFAAVASNVCSTGAGTRSTEDDIKSNTDVQ